MEELEQTDKKSTSITYRIAGLLLKVILPQEVVRQEVLPSFEPFWTVDNGDGEYSCIIEVSDEQVDFDLDGGKLLSDISSVWGERFRFYEQENAYLTTIFGEQNAKRWIMKSNREFTYSTIFMVADDSSISQVLSWLIMVVYGQACLAHQSILIHASAITFQNKGYAFLGKSGTGKSTHSRLWLANVEGTALLNDDNPALRLEKNGQVYLYGTPWSGKTSCYKNRKVPLEALVRLKQSSENSIAIKTGVEALLAVLPSCTAIRWNRQLFTTMTNTVEAIVSKVKVAELENLPNREAAILCKTTLQEIEN